MSNIELSAFQKNLVHNMAQFLADDLAVSNLYKLPGTRRSGRSTAILQFLQKLKRERWNGTVCMAIPHSRSMTKELRQCAIPEPDNPFKLAVDVGHLPHVSGKPNLCIFDKVPASPQDPWCHVITV